MEENSNFFPLIVGRKGGAPLQLLKQLDNTKIPMQIGLLLELEFEKERAKQALIEQLFQTIRLEHNDHIKKELIHFKRDVYNDRPINKYAQLEISDVLTITKQEYLKRLDTHQKAYEAFKVLLENDLYNSFEKLFEISETYFLQNGLLFSSFELLIRCSKIQFKKQRINKKSKRCIISLLKYFTRSVVKTTPFSSFNNLFYLEYDRKKSVFSSLPTLPKMSNLQINNLFFYYLKQLLLKREDFISHLVVRCNQSLREDTFRKNGLSLLVNEANCETFKRLTDSPTLEYIRTLLKDHDLSFQQLVIELKKCTGKTTHQIKNYLMNLIKEGVLQINYPVVMNDEEWMKKLEVYIRKFLKNEDDLFNTVSALLNEVSASILQLEESRDTDVRKKLILKIHGSIIYFFSIWGQEIPFYEKVKPQDLFFEDTVSNDPESVSSETYLAVTHEVKSCFHHLQEVSQKNKLKRKLAKEMTKNQLIKLSVLDFYEKLFLPIAGSISTFPSLGEFPQDFSSSFAELIEKNNSTTDTIDVQPWLSKRLPGRKQEIPFGVYFQSNGDDWGKIAINNFTAGLGANISRFLRFLPLKHHQKVVQYNEEIKPDFLLADTKDASIHNLNNYRPLTKYLINCFNNDKSEGQRLLSLNKVFVKVDENHDLMLFNDQNRKVQAINFSFENVKRRSSLLQFLDLFDPFDASGYAIFLRELNQIYRSKSINCKVVNIPRIYFGDRIILQRRKWLVEKSELQEILSNNLPFVNRLIDLTKWRKKHKIPDHVFIRIGSRLPQRLSNDHYKPQFVNFNSPIFLMLFQNLIKKSEEVIEISEMFPDTSSIQQNGGFAKEFALNIY